MRFAIIDKTTPHHKEMGVVVVEYLVLARTYNGTTFSPLLKH